MSIETKRLYIRRFEAEDWADLYEYMSDEIVVKYEPYPPLTEAQCRHIAKSRAESDEFWAVCLKGKHKVIGNIYVSAKEQSIWEIGFVFNFSYQKMGYATESVEALAGGLFTEKGAHRIFAMCNPENIRSWKLLERVGFQREGLLRQNVYFKFSKDGAPLWQDTYIYGLLKEEWQK